MRPPPITTTTFRTNTVHILIITIQNPESTVLHYQEAA